MLQKLMPKKERDIEFKKQVIMTAAWDLFERNGYASVTMDNIAKRSDYALGTIYKVFERKEDIFISIIRAKLGELNSIFEHSDDPSLNAVQRLKKILNETLNYSLKNRTMIQIFTIERWANDFEFARIIKEEFKDHLAGLSSYLEKIIDAGIKEGHFKKMEVNKARMVLRGILIEFFWNRLIGNITEEPKDMVDDIISFFLYGIVVRNESDLN